MKDWPPKDWRSILALLFSVLGAVALTLLIYFQSAFLLPREGWSVASEAARVNTLRWALWIGCGCVLLVLTGLGFAINHRRLSGKWGDRSIDWEGGERAAGDEGSADVQGTVAEDTAGQAEGAGGRG